MALIRRAICMFILIATSVFVNHSQAASFALSVNDEEGRPLADVVAALYPDKAIDYNQMPTAIMDQRNKMFDPKVLAIRVNTQVRFPNSDDVRHHVYSFSPAKKFELRLYHGLTAEPIVFDQAGTVVLGCNIHDSMIGYIYVLNTEYFAKSDSSGKLTVENLPEGEYQLELHHPDLPEDYPREKIQISSTAITSKVIRLRALNPAPVQKPVDEFDNLF
jgi:plastocyanin